ncbi:hypothetical protein BD311DRAFT_843123 [Dichomitus squalens]|uniref:RING-type E3 ubiquitin transferase n=1 Tax=Dichomitus squalens TaxID=114155 RepID=A0A4Q9MN38_9APHY|nr:hypothetical protein BD311DRAFT_843123 [Dichomitus squalens]
MSASSTSTTRVTGPAPISVQTCRFYIQGKCKFGTKCRFSHERPSQVCRVSTFSPPHPLTRPTYRYDTSGVPAQNVAPPSVSPRPGPEANKPKFKRGARPCFAWEKTGVCPRGEECWYAHDPANARVESERAREAASADPQDEVVVRMERVLNGSIAVRGQLQHAHQEQARLAQESGRITQEELARKERERAYTAQLAEEEEARRHTEVEERLERERAHRARLAEEDAARRRELEAAAAEERFQARATEEAAVTLQRVILGSIVTFAAGLEVRAVLTGFECCAVKIKNLPADTREDEVTEFITQQGIDPARFQLVGVKMAQDGKKEADVVTAADLADLLSCGPDGIEFKGERIELQIGAYNVPGGMGASSVRDDDVLTVSWRVPSIRYIAEYDDYAQAQERARELDRKIYAERRLHVEMNTLPPGRTIKGFNPNSIKIYNLPTSITEDDVRLFTQASRVRPLLQKGRSIGLPPKLAFQQLLREIERVSSRNVVHHEQSTRERGKDVDGIVSYRIRFTSPEEARVVYEELSGRIFPMISPIALWLRLPEPMCFNLILPKEQYGAQRALWDALVNSATDRKACVLSVKPDGNVVRVRLSGNAKQAVGMLKVRVENLARGEPLVGWHRSLGFFNNPFPRRVLDETGAYLRSDWRRQVLRVYGEPRAVERAREMVKAELERLEGLDFTVTLKQVSVAFFVRQGIATLKELIGEDAVTFHPWARRITISGGEEARHHLSRLIDESLRGGVSIAQDGELQCPICFDDGGDRFPLACMADEGRCGRPIALPTIQAFLPPNKFLDLLESAVESYIEKHPAEIKHCKTPDCIQIYRATAEGTASNALQCPSCFSEVCSGCGEDVHRGFSCEERKRVASWSLDDEWMREQGFKKCPSCSTPIQKTEGCNHMECRCGAHLCWVCMRAFDDGRSTYAHLHEVHGGIHENAVENAPPALANVDMNEQYEVLRQAERLRLQRQERERQNQLRGWEHDILREDRVRQQEERAHRQEEARRQQEARQRELDRIFREQQEERRRRLAATGAQAQEANRGRQDGGWCLLM